MICVHMSNNRYKSRSTSTVCTCTWELASASSDPGTSCCRYGGIIVIWFHWGLQPGAYFYAPSYCHGQSFGGSWSPPEPRWNGDVSEPFAVRVSTHPWSWIFVLHRAARCRVHGWHPASCKPTVCAKSRHIWSHNVYQCAISDRLSHHAPAVRVSFHMHPNAVLAYVYDASRIWLWHQRLTPIPTSYDWFGGWRCEKGNIFIIFIWLSVRTVPIKLEINLIN